MKETLEQKIGKIKDKISHIIIPLTISYLSGLGLGLLGKHTHKTWIPAVPPAIDLMYGAISPHFLSYGVGVVTAYLPEIYPFIKNLLF